jgi:DNA polymerase-3 subunit alpha (Gram-positive type)
VPVFTQIPGNRKHSGKYCFFHLELSNDVNMLSSLVSVPLSSVEFTSLDLETTGFYPGKSEILEVSAIRFTKDSILSEFSSFSRPEKSIEPEATKINGITAEMVRDAPPLSLVLNEFIPFLSNSILVIQNSTFDLSFLLFEANRYGIEFSDLPVFCTVQLSRKIFPKSPKHNLNSLRTYLNIPRMRKRTENTSTIHEAVDDSFAAMEVFKKCLDKVDGWQKPFPEVVHHEKGLKFIRDYKKK